MTWFAMLIGLVALERVAELWVSRRNAAWAKQRGAVEFGAEHYPVMVVLHTGLLAGALVEMALANRPFLPALGWTCVGLVVASQALRWWCIRTLGPRWNTRVLVVPRLPLVQDGPYRFIAHPNYVAVAVEGLALPLVHTVWITALAFSLANAALLAVRIRVENAALRSSENLDGDHHVQMSGAR